MRSIEKVACAGFRQIEQLSVTVTEMLEREATRGAITPLAVATLFAYIFIVFRSKD